MQLKDYYKLLELPPSADPDDIKKAYRRLAHQYHPDKNGDDKYALTRFAAIKEAYETLSNPQKKEEYLQQRWYAQSTGKWKHRETVTPDSILTQLIELERFLYRADIHRLDKVSLTGQLRGILSDEAIEVLNSFNEVHINDRIISDALTCCGYLSYELNAPLLKKLERIQASENMISSIDRFRKSSLRASGSEKRQFIFVLLAVLAVCALIYFFSH